MKHTTTNEMNSQSSSPMSRRGFARMAALLTAGAALPFYSESQLAFAQLSRSGPIPPDAVKINANENPLGPCPEALEAMKLHRAALAAAQKGE